MPTPTRAKRVRFGIFEADLCSGELYRQGRRIKLHQQPFQVLAMLLEHPGEVVTREELRRTLWPADTFVNFDIGLNAAVRKLRQALHSKARVADMNASRAPATMRMATPSKPKINRNARFNPNNLGFHRQ